MRTALCQLFLTHRDLMGLMCVSFTVRPRSQRTFFLGINDTNLASTTPEDNLACTQNCQNNPWLLPRFCQERSPNNQNHSSFHVTFQVWQPAVNPAHKDTAQLLVLLLVCLIFLGEVILSVFIPVVWVASDFPRARLFPCGSQLKSHSWTQSIPQAPQGIMLKPTALAV